MSKRCRDCYLFETDACPCLFYAWEDNIACGHFVDESRLPNKYSEKLYEIAYQRGSKNAIDKIYSYVKRECNPYGKPTIDFESGKKILNYLNQLKEQKNGK